MKKVIMVFISVFLLMSAIPVKAEKFWVTGNVKRTLTDDSAYNGCMILLSTSLGNGCPGGGWVSLDCKGVEFSASAGSRKYASAIVAASTNKQVSIYVDNAKTAGPYCIAQRLDVIF